MKLALRRSFVQISLGVFMGLYLELGFFVFLSTPFLGLALAPKIKLVTVAICAIL